MELTGDSFHLLNRFLFGVKGMSTLISEVMEQFSSAADGSPLS